MRILLTGFEPFGQLEENPTRLLIKRLRDNTGILPPHQYEFAVLPTVFGQSSEALRKLLKYFQPELVILTGVAEVADKIRLEKIALNVDDGRIPDTKGFQPEGLAIEIDGPLALSTTMDIQGIKDHLAQHKIPAEISWHAGTYVCNHLYYSLLYAIDLQTTKGLFVHVPNVLADNSKMDMNDLEKAVVEIINWSAQSQLA